jgi:hypothetical protein
LDLRPGQDPPINQDRATVREILPDPLVDEPTKFFRPGPVDTARERLDQGRGEPTGIRLACAAGQRPGPDLPRGGFYKIPPSIRAFGAMILRLILSER